jgi:hypothetical protein
MDEKSWDGTVKIKLKSRTSREVGNVMEAADCLFTAWPRHQGAAFDEALKVFAQVFDGRREPSAARKAFIAAAKEARLPVDA